MIRSRLRIVFAILLLVASLAVLAWSFLPGTHIVRRQKIEPTEMQLPTPASFTPTLPSMVWLDIAPEAARAMYAAGRFRLLVGSFTEMIS
jgi:hypothetical protein